MSISNSTKVGHHLIVYWRSIPLRVIHHTFKSMVVRDIILHFVIIHNVIFSCAMNFIDGQVLYDYLLLACSSTKFSTIAKLALTQIYNMVL